MSRRSWSADDKRLVGARASWRCESCESLLPASFECDHVVPLEDGGADDIESNSQALCNRCHADKTQRERRVRIERATKRLRELRDAEAPAKQSDKRVEDVILDTSNPFARFVFSR
jgi:5-methylcytosine-specific restriction endonuclease McrA